MSLPKGRTALALPERSHIHDEVADELGLDVDRLRADIADAIREPLLVGAE